MANEIRREKVQDPFAQPMPTVQRQMEQFNPLPRTAFQQSVQGTQIVDALVNFAGLGAELYTNQMGKKIAEDKIVQSGLADAKKRPTDDATIAGVRAHAAVMMQDVVMKRQLQLNELAKQNVSDEQWDEAVRDSYRYADKYMTDNYSTYSTDKEMQKLLPLAFREMMPQLNASREANQLQVMIQKGKDSATDYLVNQAKLMKESGVNLPPENIADTFDYKLKALKLTSKEKDDVIENAIVTSKSPALLEAAKKWTGDRKSSLFDRSAKLQQLEKKLINESLSTEAVAMETKLQSIKQGIVSGDILINEGMAMFDKMNKATNGEAVSRGFIAGVWSSYYNQRSAELEMTRAKSILSNPNNVDPGDLKEKTKKAAYRSIYQDEIDQAVESVKELPQEQQQAAFAAKKKQAQARVADMAVRNNDTVVPFVNILHNLATSNVAFRAQETDNGLPMLGNTEQEGIQLIEAMSPIALHQHLEQLGGRGKEARVVRDFLAYRSRGMPDPQALAQAQSNYRNLPIADAKAITAGVAEVRDNLEFFWTPDFEDKQVPYLEEQIRNQIALSSEPDSEANVDLVTEYFKKGWTQVGDLWLKGSKKYLSQQIGVEGDLYGRGSSGNNSWIKDAMDSYTWATKSEWEPMLAGNGLEEDDVFPEVDDKKGTVRLVARNKGFRANVYLTKPVPLSSIKKFMAQRKEHEQKLASESYEKANAAYKKKMEDMGLGKYAGQLPKYRKD